MTISSKNLEPYLHGMTFPVDVLAPTDDRVIFRMDRAQLRGLIAANGVIGIGSRSKVKRLRVNKLNAPVVEVADETYQESKYSGGTKYTYRETYMENQPYTLKRVGEGGAYEHWDDKAAFTPGRFNPDQMATPLIPSRVLVAAEVGRPAPQRQPPSTTRRLHAEIALEKIAPRVD
jgi:hypothetical protein